MVTITNSGTIPHGMTVNDEGQAFTLSEIQSEARHVSEEGDLYLIASDIIALTTTGSFSSVFYVKNTSTTKDIHIGHFRTCGDIVCQWRMYEIITAGTLLSDATTALASNMKHGSPNNLVADVYVGADGKTLTGTLVTSWINGVGHSQPDFGGSLILTANQSIALEVKPASAGSVCISIEAWQVDG